VGSPGFFAIQRRRQNFVISRQWVAQQVDDGQRPLLASPFALVSLHTQIVALWFGSTILLFFPTDKRSQNGLFQHWLKGVNGVVFIRIEARLATFKPNL
jgi:hypothetical protein